MLSIEQRVYTLSYLWKEAEYNFAFWAMHKDIDWDKAYREFLPKVIDAKDDFEYFCLLKRFYALLGDGHTCVQFPEDLLCEFSLPIEFDYYGGDFYVTAVPEGEEDHLLKKLIAVNGVPIIEFIEEYVNLYYWHEMPLSLYKSGNCISVAAVIAFRDDQIAFESERGSLLVSLHDKRKTTKAKLTKKNYGQVKQIFVSESCDISLTRDNIGIIHIPSFCSDSLVDDVLSVRSQLDSAAAIVIDLRGNDGGMGEPPFHFAQLFFGGEYVCRNHFRTPSHNAQLRALEPYLDVSKINTDEWKHKQIYKVKNHIYYEENNEEFIESFDYYDTAFTQPTVILTDWDTACAAEGMVDYFKMAKRAATVGSVTYGSGSEAMIRELEGGGKMWLGTTWTTLCSGEEYVNVGIKPDYEVENTLEDELQGYDRVFQKACEIARSLCSQSTI